MKTLIARHKAGEHIGICSVCSAHPLVIEAALALSTGWDYTGPPPVRLKPGVALSFAVTGANLVYEGPVG